MSIYTAMRAGVSGLQANSTAMAVIADNIANVQTTAFKRSETQFAHMVNSYSSGVGYNAGGVLATTRRFNDVQGSLQQSASAMDIAIAGDGLFVVTDDPAANGAGGALFSRAGSFSLDRAGRLVNAQGYYLLGGRIDPDNPNVTPSAIAGLTTVDFSDVGATAEVTTKADIVANLDSRQTAHVGYTPGQLTSGAVSAHMERAIEIYDSLGAVRTLTLSFLKTSTPLNEWVAEVFYTNPNTGLKTTLAAGALSFGDDGTLSTAPTQVPAPPAPPAFPLLSSFTIDWTNVGPPATGSGAADQPMSLTLSNTTQFAVASSLTSATADGAPPGEVVGVDVSPEGVVSAEFSNGRLKPLYRLPIATFQSPQRLTTESGSVFRQSHESGQPILNTPGSGGAGVLQTNALEASNVDLGLEFTNLITTQRAYSASSRIISTADEMLEELIRIKR
jgi:flagellar hook protein FlgE